MTPINQASTLTQEDLSRFRGTTAYYQYSQAFSQFVLTEGTLYLAEKGQCYWLMDKIASLQMHKDIKNHPRLKHSQFWQLDVREDRVATLRCDWDKDCPVYKENILNTDFPLDQVRIWVASTWFKDTGAVMVAFLPSEY